MAMTAQRRAEIEAMAAPQSTTSTITPERRAQIDAMLSGQTAAPAAKTQPGGFQRFVQGVAKPFVNVATNVANFAEGTANLAGAGIASLSGNQERSQELQNKANEAAFKQRDFGYLGKGNAVGGDRLTGDVGADIGKGIKQIVGTGAEIASYAAPTALGTGAKAVAAGGKVMPTLGALAKGGATAGSLGSTGAALQENRSAGQVLGAGLTGAALGTGLSLVAPLVGKTAGKVGQKFGKDARVQGIVDNNYRALTQLEDNNAALRKVIAKNKQRGIDPKRLLAESDYLVGAVDDTGTLRTMQEGGAVSKARDFINPMEDVVTANLKREGKTISLEDIRQQMINNVNASGIKGGDKINALRKIESEISGLMLEADGNGNVPLSIVHDAKRYKYANIDYLNPGAKNTDKIIARTLKDVVEKGTESVDVKKLNDELSGYYSMLSFLEKLDGRKVQGGKLGKYFAQTIGAMVGSSVGGPVGTVVGAELGGRLRGSMMKSTFSKASGKAPKASALLEDAIKLGKTPPVPPKPLLGLPAPDPTKTGPTIPLGGPTTFEPRASIIGGAGQTPRMGTLQRPLQLPEPTGTTGAPIRMGQSTTYEPRAKVVGTTPKVIDAKATVLDSENVIKKLRNAKKVSTPAASTKKELLEEARKYSSAEEFIKKEMVLVKDVDIDASTIKLSGDASEKTAADRASRMVPIQELNKPVMLKITSDGSYQVVDGNARVTAHRNQNVPITKYVLSTKYSDKSQLTDIWNKANKN